MPVVYIINGPNSSGKSYYTEQNFENYLFLDLADFYVEAESSPELALDAESELEKALRELIKTNEENQDIVLEITLYKQERWQRYVDAIREEEPSENFYSLNMIIIKPDLEMYQRRMRSKGLFAGYAEFLLDYFEIPEESVVNNLQIVEDTVPENEIIDLTKIFNNDIEWKMRTEELEKQEQEEVEWQENLTDSTST